MRLTATIQTLMLAGLGVAAPLWAAPPLPGTSALERTGDLAEQMVAGIHTDVDGRLENVQASRAEQWSGRAQDPAFLQEKRDKLRTIVGAVDPRTPTSMTTCAAPGSEGPLARGDGYQVYHVRWPVFDGVWGEGLLVEPDKTPTASLVLLPDADQNPWDLLASPDGAARFGAGLAATGTRIVIPALISRADTHSGHPEVRMTNQPHREFIYRGAYEMGRHVIGYELQKVFAAIDWLADKTPDASVGVFGYGEGGLLALHAAALDTRIDAALVSGYFGPRDGLWQEPIYRNVWQLQTDFSDAELAAMIAPRKLVIEPSAPPQVTGPPMTEGRSHGAAPGAIPEPSLDQIRREADRALAYVPNAPDQPWLAVVGNHGGAPGQADAVAALTGALGLATTDAEPPAPNPGKSWPDSAAVQERQFHQLMDWTAHILDEAPFTRAALWSKADATSVETWETSTEWYRNHFHEEIIGKLPEPAMPFNARSRAVYNTDTYRGYEVTLDTYPDVFAYGILLVPKDIPDGEKRPVVVCQHGLEGRPQDLADPDVEHRAYEQYGCKLAERGFIVYAPQNPYIGGDHFRTLQRKANPLGLSLFSYIVAQHDQTLKWLATLPFVDPERIAFYGLSYGGKTAMRVPAILEDYCLSICAGDYNEWIWKNVTTRQIYSYMFHGEYEMFEWNLGNTYNYAEMSWLICPRPFMVERGHHDGVAPDAWVAYEYAKTQRRYNLLGIGDRTTIEYFNGPHKIHGVGTFAFLHDQLDFPAPTDE